MILEATHTHLYPGCQGTVSGLAQIADLKTGADCQVVFADGSMAYAGISKSANAWQLFTQAYRTAAGAEITQTRWLIRLQEQGAQVSFRILKKVKGG